MNFRIKEKLVFWISGSKKVFSTQKVSRKMIFPYYFLRNAGTGCFGPIKKAIRWYFLQHGISCLLITKKFLFQNFWGWKMWYFLSQNVDGKMIFSHYWKVNVLNFLLMGNMVFFLSQEVDGKDDIYWLLRSFCLELFGGKYDLFSAKKLMKRWYLLGLFELSMISQDLWNTVFHAVLSALLCWITLKHDGSFYCWRCHRSFWTKSKLKCHVKVCKKKDFCGIVMPFEKENILEFNQVFQFFSFPLLITFLWKSL